MSKAKELKDAVELLEGFFTVDNDNEIGEWTKTGWEHQGETLFAANISRSDLKALKQATKLIVDTIGEALKGKV